MSVEPISPAEPSSSSIPADGGMEEGRRYWKAAIAHLAPEKREAAWEFYLDRLESSAAADTLGGVMLLLEAHLAFFDDLPARLGRAAQQLDAAFQPSGQPDCRSGAPPRAIEQSVEAAPHGRWRYAVLAGVSAVAGGIVAHIFLPTFGHQGASIATSVAPQAGSLLSTYANPIRVGPWRDPSSHRQRGSVLFFDRACWTEHTSGGGAKVYILSPVEEVRRDLQALRRASE